MDRMRAAARWLLQGKHAVMRRQLEPHLLGDGSPLARRLSALLRRAGRLAAVRGAILALLALSVLGGAALVLVGLLLGESAASVGERLLQAVRFWAAPVALVATPALLLLNHTLGKLDAEIFLGAAELHGAHARDLDRTKGKF